jgi:hypothetical protein
MSEDEAYRKAERRAEEKIGFFTHLVVYLVVNVILIVINLTQSPDSLWFYWALLGWGIGVFFHGMGVFVWGEGSNWRERMIQKELDRQRRQ